ncbi:MAG: TIGR03435 family protein [Bryobacteraceae bacterium]
MRRTVTAIMASALLGALAFAQEPPADPNLKFEVATMKTSPPGQERTGPCGIRPQPGGQSYSADCMSLKGFLTVIYRIKPDQVTGGPAWADSDRFEMRGKAEKSSSADELHVMLRNLLLERFKLQYHFEKKELPIYALTVDKGGPKLTPHEAKNAGDPWIDQTQAQFLHMKMVATFCPLEYLAFRLGQMMDRPVVDMTGLKGGYDFTLEFTRELPPNIPETAQINGSPIDTSGLTVYEAVQKQLGLKLERQKGPAPILVIDRAEKLVDSN